MKFVWNEKNIEHIAKHAISPLEAEYLVENARSPYPRMIGDAKRLVVGKLADGQYAQAIYVPSRSVSDAVYVIHSRLLTDDEQRRFRRRKR
jgi:hypothetical protein